MPFVIDGGTHHGGSGAVQDQLFYAFNLDDHVPRDHLLRGVDRFLDLGELRQHLAPFYGHTGRPLIDPELMIRMLVIDASITKADTIIYRASQTDCTGCAMKDRCCPNTPYRKIARSVHEGARDVARSIAQTPQYGQSRRERKKVEMLFAHLKRIMKLDRLRLRGLSGAQDEFLMAATAQNLRRMAKWLMPSEVDTEMKMA